MAVVTGNWTCLKSNELEVYQVSEQFILQRNQEAGQKRQWLFLPFHGPTQG